MSNNIVEFIEEIIKGQIKELVHDSVEETLNEESGGDGAGAAGWVSSSQVTKSQGQDKRRTATFDPVLCPLNSNQGGGQPLPPVIDFYQSHNQFCA